MERVRRLIRQVQDFPRPGIRFCDVTPVLQDAAAFAEVVEALAARYRNGAIDKVVAIESRGFVLGAPLAQQLGCGLALVRKPGKLPGPTHEVAYSLEYGEGLLQIHRDAVGQGERVVIVDDLLATGGTAAASAGLVRRCGGQVVEIAVLIELLALGGRGRVGGCGLYSLLTY